MPTVESFTEPPITAARIAYLQKQGIPKAIAEIDLEMVKSKMREPVRMGGLHWRTQWCEIAEVEYKRFLTLRLLWPKQVAVPTTFIDQMWHYHILATKTYREDCKRVFGTFLDHDPYFGGSDYMLAAAATERHYERTFGELMIRQLIPTQEEQDGKRRLG
jgi:hypothetical protein